MTALTISGQAVKLTAFKIFEYGEGVKDPAPFPNQSRFLKSSSRYIYWHFQLEHSQIKSPIHFSVDAVYKKSNGEDFGTSRLELQINADGIKSFFYAGLGWKDPGNWPAGSYTLDILINGEKLTGGTFEIYIDEKEVEEQIGQFARVVEKYTMAHQAYDRTSKAYHDNWQQRRNAVSMEYERELLQRQDSLQEGVNRTVDEVMAKERDLNSWSAHMDKLPIPTIALARRLDALYDQVDLTKRGTSGSNFKTVDRWFREKTGKSAQEYSDIAVFHANGNRLDRAIDIARQGVKLFPENSHLSHFYLDLLEKAGKTDELIPLLQGELVKSPAKFELKQRIAQQFLKSNRSDEAIDFLQNEFYKNPADLELGNYLVELLVEKKQTDRAVKILREILLHAPGNMDLVYKVAVILRNSGKMSDAITFLAEVNTKLPRDVHLRATAVKFLTETLAENNVENSRAAIDSLYQYGNSNAYNVLWQVYKQSRADDLRLRALQVMAEHEAKSILPGLLDVEKDADALIRKHAAQLFKQYGDASHVDHLAHWYKTETDKTVKRALKAALSSLDTIPRTFGEKLTRRRPWAG